MIISNHNNTYLWCTIYDDLRWVRVTWNLLMMNSNKRNIIETENDAQTVYCILTSSLTRKFLCALYVLVFLYFPYLLFFICSTGFYFFSFYQLFISSVAFALLVERTCANYVCPELWYSLWLVYFVWEYTVFFFFVMHTPLVTRDSLLRIRGRDTRSGLC